MTADGTTVPLDPRMPASAGGPAGTNGQMSPRSGGLSETPPSSGAVPGITRLTYGRHIRVLLVESDGEETERFIAGAEESVLDVHIDVERSVEDAVARMERHAGPRWRRHMPDIVVACLPVEDSHRLLTCLRQDTRFDTVPLIVLSEESTPALERRSFALGAAGHLRTPRRVYERVALVHALPDFIPSARAAHAEIESRR